MSDVSYIGWSLLVGFVLATVVVLTRGRNGPSLAGWKKPLIAVVVFMFGFGLVRTFGDLVFDNNAMPSWSSPAKELWFFVVGTSFIVEPKSDTGFAGSKGGLILGFILIVVGAVAFADGATHFLHGA